MGSGIRGFVDASTEFGNWLKLVRTTNQSEAQNVRPMLVAGQVRHSFLLRIHLFLCSFTVAKLTFFISQH